MNELTDLVPPLELCKLLPEGEFAESVLVWRVPNSSFPLENEFYEIHERDKCESWMKDKQIPAPTLKEIMEKFPNTVKVDFWGESYHIYNDTTNGYGFTCKKPESAAIRLWMRLKGINYA